MTTLMKSFIQKAKNFTILKKARKKKSKKSDIGSGKEISKKNEKGSGKEISKKNDKEPIPIVSQPL